MHTRFLKPLRIAFIGTYPPRQCGIATFTQDLLTALNELYGNVLADEAQRYLHVIAMHRGAEPLDYPPEVRFAVRDHREEDYLDAAEFINLSPIDVVSLQHEYGIFGGEDGSHIIELLEHVRKPVVTTLHTVLHEPSPSQREVLQEIAARSTLLVAQTRKSAEMLCEIYDVPADRIAIIYHGAPDVPFLDPAYYKDQFGAEGRPLILTFGLLSPNKGIEYAIEAMAEVAREFPEALYFVVGATHPEVRKRYGESYRLSLEERVKRLGIEENVVFHNRYVSLEELIKFLVAADIFLAPYLVREQAVSGTITYALATGKAIVSTPSWYAEEMLAEGRGILVPFRDAGAMARALLGLLRDEAKRDRMRKAAYEFGRQMVWREVAGQYAEAFERALVLHARAGKRPFRAFKLHTLPEVDLSHLRRLTDGTGVLQHAIYTIPDRRFGYTTDDNARALIVTLLHWDLYGDREIWDLMHTYFSFLHYAQTEGGWFRNLLTYERTFSPEGDSEDAQGRAIWALGHAVASKLPEDLLALSIELFRKALPTWERLSAARALAFAVLGGAYYLEKFPGDTEVKGALQDLAGKLHHAFVAGAKPDWPWPEEVLTYDNARLPQALIVAGRALERREYVERGIEALRWLIEVQTDPHGDHLSLVGNQGWYPRGGERARFDQQPLDAAALVDACREAALITGDPFWWREMERAFAWFLGRNDLGVPLYDFTTGGCYDGLQPTGVNRNQGAESTISWLTSLLLMKRTLRRRTVAERA